MSVEAALVIALTILTATLVGLLALFLARKRAAAEEELKRAASARGWQFESVLERGYRVHRWRGTAEGISWQAESLVQVSGGGKHQRRRHVARWHGGYAPGINGPIVCMGVTKGAETHSFSIAQGDGMFAKLAQKAAGFAFDKAIDVYFGDEIGKEVDAAALRRVEGTNIPGFIVMAADKDEGARVLAQGLQRALAGIPHDDTWLLLRPKGISLARMERFRDVTDIEGFIRAGVALKSAFAFGRPTLS